MSAAKFREETSNTASHKPSPLHRAIWRRRTRTQPAPADYLLGTFGGGFKTGIVVPVAGSSLSIPGSTAGGWIVPLDCDKRWPRVSLALSWPSCADPCDLGASGDIENGGAGDWLGAALCCAASACRAPSPPRRRQTTQTPGWQGRFRGVILATVVPPGARHVPKSHRQHAQRRRRMRQLHRTWHAPAHRQLRPARNCARHATPVPCVWQASERDLRRAPRDEPRGVPPPPRSPGVVRIGPPTPKISVPPVLTSSRNVEACLRRASPPPDNG